MAKRRDEHMMNQQGREPAWDDFAPDLLVDLIDEAGQITWMNATQAEALGGEARAGLTVEACYTAPAAAALAELNARALPEGFVTTLELTLIGPSGREIRTMARCRKTCFEGRPHFRLIKLGLGHIGQAYDDLRADTHLLSRIIADASEAHWCIEFLEPVDINRERNEVVDQIFENRSIWRIANPAMMALYGLPEPGAFRAFDVRLYWPRTPANEAFVGQIIDSHYRIDAALSSDRRHDGTNVTLENDVRAEIRETYLYRIWGNCRLGGSTRPISLMPASLAALPHPVLLLGAGGQELARNDTALHIFGAALPGAAAVAQVVAQVVARALAGKPGQPCSLAALAGRGPFLATAYPLIDARRGALTVLLLQPAPAPP